MPLFSKQNFKLVVTDYAPTLMGLRIPGFIKIHIRYILSNPFVWAVLFLAPFVIGQITLSQFSRHVLEIEPRGVAIFLIVLFLIALSFYFAERNRAFRYWYVRAVPAIVVLNGLVSLFTGGDFSFGALIVFGILSLFPAWILWRWSTGMGYRMLSNGADRKYRPGRDLYMEGDYERAFTYLEPSAKRGHMKSLYLMGHAYEHGTGYEQDRVKAARFYDKSAKKGYKKAQDAFERLCESFTPEEREAFERDTSPSGLNDLF